MHELPPNTPGPRGPYRVGALLGTGALAHVYEGVNTVTGDLVAIKVPKADVPFGAYHLRAEYRARIGVHHANLVSEIGRASCRERV